MKIIGISKMKDKFKRYLSSNFSSTHVKCTMAKQEIYDISIMLDIK